MIEIRNVKKKFRMPDGTDFWALKGINMTIPTHKLVILRGRSGSGKTTLLNIISTLDDASEGDVFFDDQKISDMSVSEKEHLRRNEIGFVFQSIALIPVMTAYENVQFAAKLAGMKENVPERICEVLESVGMQDRMEHLPVQLSGGQQQRVAIARAVVHKPRIIIADEPSGALDTGAAHRVMDLFRQLTRKEGITILMTTHDPELMELADIVYEMEAGNIISEVKYEHD